MKTMLVAITAAVILTSTKMTAVAEVSQVVSKAGTTTALVSSPNPSCSGQPVTLTATVSAVAPGPGFPTGTVDFMDGSAVIGNDIPLDGSAVATFISSSLSAGNHNLTAVYNASGSFSGSTSSSMVLTVSDGDVVIQDWKNIPANEATWQSPTLQTNDATYPEGGTVPFRLTLPQPCVGGTWSITLQYDFRDEATGVHFCDFLTSYNAYEPSVNGHECEGETCGGAMTFPIPSDPSLSYQLPGVFRVENGTITSVSAYSTTISGGVTEKFLTLTGTAAPGANVLILLGAHLARDYEWGSDKGAAQWPQGTASIGFVAYSGGSGTGTAGHANVKVAEGILDNPSQADLWVGATASPDSASPGDQVAYHITVNNSGPNAASPDTLSDAIPSGTTFVSATSPAGWSVTAPAVGGVGIVRWIRSTAFSADASAAFELVVAVDSAAVGTIENVATVAAGSVDAYQPNNSVRVTVTVRPINHAPVVSITSPASGASFAMGTPVTFVGSFSDDAGDTHTAVWTFDDVDVPGVVDDSAGSVEVSYVFTSPGVHSVKLTVTDQAGESGASTQVGGAEAQVVAYDPNAIAGVDAGDPIEFRLAQNAPNPFRNGTQVHFSLPVQSHVRLGVFDVAGREVVSLSNQDWGPGSHVVSWSGRMEGGALARGGVYIVRMVAEPVAGGEHYRSQKKMVRID